MIKNSIIILPRENEDAPETFKSNIMNHHNGQGTMQLVDNLLENATKRINVDPNILFGGIKPLEES